MLQLYRSMREAAILPGWRYLSSAQRWRGAKREKITDEDVEDIESIEDMMTHQDGEFMRSLVQQEEKNRLKIKKSMIERKYFKRPQESNLLTWDAKEQIRYLHAEFPDEWTVNRLTQSFPVSRDGVIKLLKSKWTPRTLKDVIKHDRSVQRNWSLLESGKSEDAGGPLAMRYQMLLESGALDNISNAAGIKSLPMPKTKFLQYPENNRLPMKPGLFGSIVKDYVDKKQRAIQSNHTNQPGHQTIDDHRQNTQKLLSSVTPNHKSAKLMVKSHANNATPRNEESSMTEYFKSPNERTLDTSAALDKISLFDLHLNPDEDDIPKELPKRRRGLARPRATRPSLIQPEHGNNGPSDDNITSRLYPDMAQDSGFQDTVKLSKHQHMKRSANDSNNTSTQRHSVDSSSHDIDEDNNDDIPSVFDKMNTPKETKYALGQIKPDKTRRGVPVEYMYDDDTGYQYPYGKPDIDIDDIDIDKVDKTVERNQEAITEKVYRRGKSYYDEDGEFLYRTP